MHNLALSKSVWHDSMSISTSLFFFIFCCSKINTYLHTYTFFVSVVKREFLYPLAYLPMQFSNILINAQCSKETLMLFTVTATNGSTHFRSYPAVGNLFVFLCRFIFHRLQYSLYIFIFTQFVEVLTVNTICSDHTQAYSHGHSNACWHKMKNKRKLYGVGECGRVKF